MAQRNNLERALGGNPAATDQGSPAPTQTTATTSQTFSFVTPTDFVDLPSKGKSYGEGHPLHNVETIGIRHMTAKEEDILTSESLLKKGLAVDRMLQSVVVDKSIKIKDLLIGDKNALIMASRVTGFGPHYETKISCPTCSKMVNHSFNLNELELEEEGNLPDNVTLLENGNFEVNLENIDFKVQIKLLTGADEAKWTATKEKRKKMKLPEAAITDQLKMIIVAVNDVADKGLIKQFIDALPARASREIRASYDRVMPNVDLTQEFTCEECDHEGRIAVPLTADFFWPDT